MVTTKQKPIVDSQKIKRKKKSIPLQKTIKSQRKTSKKIKKKTKKQKAMS